MAAVVSVLTRCDLCSGAAAAPRLDGYDDIRIRLPSTLLGEKRKLDRAAHGSGITATSLAYSNQSPSASRARGHRVAEKLRSSRARKHLVR